MPILLGDNHIDHLILWLLSTNDDSLTATVDDGNDDDDIDVANVDGYDVDVANVDDGDDDGNFGQVATKRGDNIWVSGHHIDYLIILLNKDDVNAVANNDDDDGNFGQVATRRGVDISDKGALCPFHSLLAREQHTRHLTFNSLHIFHTGCLTFNNLQQCAEYMRWRFRAKPASFTFHTGDTAQFRTTKDIWAFHNFTLALTRHCGVLVV